MAREEGHLRADTDARQMLFELHGLALALHHDARFLRTPGAVQRAEQGERARSLPRRTERLKTEAPRPAPDIPAALLFRRPIPQDCSRSEGDTDARYTPAA